MLNKILFITDNCELKKEYTIKVKDSEGNKIAARDEMITALKRMCKDVTLTYSVEEANKYIINNKDSFIITTYYGEASPDSKSMIPIICKANKVKFLGADAYTQMICNDKFLSKQYIYKFGLTPTKGIIIYNPDNKFEIQEIDNLTFPLIIKPNFGGGSNGIINNSVTYNKEDTVKLVKELYKYQCMPILVEEYVKGFEVSFIIIGNKNNIIYSGESNLCINGKSFFNTEVFGLESKKIAPKQKSYKESNFINSEIQNKLFQLFKSFDKVEFMRVDCRIAENGNVYVMELSPDCYIGSGGAFAETLRHSGYSFEDTLKLLCENSIKNQNY